MKEKPNPAQDLDTHTCYICNGTGAIEKNKNHQSCSKCNGIGKIQDKLITDLKKFLEI